MSTPDLIQEIERLIGELAPGSQRSVLRAAKAEILRQQEQIERLKAAYASCRMFAAQPTGEGAAQEPPPQFTQKYGGDVSRPFWSWVGMLTDPYRDEAYSLGCEIQERESRLAAIAEVAPSRSLKGD